MNELLRYKEELETRKKEYQQKISEHDKETSFLLHDLETRNADGVALVKLAKELQIVQQRRRVYKTLLYETNIELSSITQEIKRIERIRKRRVNKVVKKRNSWFSHFSPEAMAIFEANTK